MNKNIFRILILIILVSFYLKNIIASENKIIFKINDVAFTLLDLEKRIEYLDFVGNNSDIDKKIIIEDYISANLFYEYFKKSKNDIDYEDKIEEIFFNIIEANKRSNKIYAYEINKELMMNNIRVDFIRKVILENILNSSINNLNTSKEEIDLLYNLKIKYVNLKLNDYSKYKNEIDKLENINFNNLQFILNKNKINYFVKETEINNINKIRKDIRENILLKCQGIFSCMGNEYWKDGELIYQKEFELDDDAHEWRCHAAWCRQWHPHRSSASCGRCCRES